MSASKVITRRGPEYPRTDSFHYKTVDLTLSIPSKPSPAHTHLMKSDLVKPSPDEKADSGSETPDSPERLKHSDFEFLTTLGYV